MIKNGDLRVKFCEGKDGRVYISFKMQEYAVERLKEEFLFGLEDISIN